MSADEAFDLDFAFDAWAEESARAAGRGKLGEAPCGHRGEAVIGTYYKCLEGCDDPPESDGVPEHVDPEITKPVCPWSQGFLPDCDGEGDVVQWGPEFRDINGRDMWSCRSCGKEFMA